MRRWLWLVAVTAAACGGSGNPTKREVCTRFVGAMCARNAECGLPPAYDSCVTLGMTYCCEGDNSCEVEDATHTDAWLNACTPLLREEPCDKLAQSLIPNACRM